MKTKYNQLIIFLLTAFYFINNVNAQILIQEHETNPLSLSGFLNDVVKGNIGYIAKRLNVGIAEAEMKAAKVFPDPEISLVYYNNEEKTLQMGQGLETAISYPINTGNVRKAGMNLSKSQYELSELILESYFKNLLADATLSYFSGIRDREIYLLRINMQKQTQELAHADSIRCASGEISSLDALQSSLEAKSLQASVFESYAEMKNTFVNLMVLQGKKHLNTFDVPADSFILIKRLFNLNDLLDSAVNKRADLLAALKNKEISEKTLDLLKANRAFEFNLEAGYSYNSIVRNEIAPAPPFKGISAGISVPLKFSNLNREQIKAAELTINQNNLDYEDFELQIRAEVIRAFNNYTAKYQKVEFYNLGLIEDAQKLLSGKIYSYQKGEADLIEVINARRTYIELQLDYIDALYEFTSSLIELERSAGIWDIFY